MKSLHHDADFEEIKSRFAKLRADSQPRWGKMNAAQMLHHCSLVLNIPLKKTVLPKTGFIVRTIGIITKNEMKLLGNGIPPNMPTYEVLLSGENCSFEECRSRLLETMENYWVCYCEGNLPNKHELFGKMKVSDWGFLEHKHLNHHLKQFKL